MSSVDGEQGAREVTGDIPAKKAWRSEDGRAQAQGQDSGAGGPMNLLEGPA